MTSTKKYEFTGEIKQVGSTTLRQIRLLIDIAAVGLVAGTLGGWIESEANLSHDGNAWVFGNARVFGNAQVFGNAWVFGDAQVFGNARVSGDAEVSGNARVSGDAQVFGNARVFGDARVFKVNLTMVRSDGYTFSVCATPEGPRIIAGCRYFTYKQAKAHWLEKRGGTQLGEESLLIVKSLKKMAKLNGLDKLVVENAQ